MKIDKDDVKRKIVEAKDKAVFQAKRFGRWCGDNKELLIVAIPAGASILSAGAKVHSRHMTKANLKKEKELQDLYVYDRSLGMYHKLRKPLTSGQAVEIERRRASGEKLASILNQMKLV